MADNLKWIKSTYSGAQGGNCVEVAKGSGVMVRDTKQHGTGPVLAFTSAAWRRFADRVKGDVRLASDAVS
jgi:hypothetical protein